MSDIATETVLGRQTKRGLTVDLKSMNAAQLRQLITDAQGELQDKQEAAKAELRAKWEAEAEEVGLSLDAVLPTRVAAGADHTRKARKDTGATLPAKYRSANGEEWSGRGRLPKWLQTLEAEGRSREEFRI